MSTPTAFKDGTVDIMANKVHTALAHSYFVHFIFILVGLLLDFIFPIKIFQHATVVRTGFVLLVLASLLIFWAQHTTRNLFIKESITKKSFEKGPYKYTRIPTHIGLLLLTLGFGVVVNTFFVVVTSLLSFIIGKMIFLRKYEEVLEEKYGTAYTEYKKEVKI